MASGFEGIDGSPQFREFLSDTLDYGIGLVESSYPLIPVVAVRQGGKVECNVMVAAAGGNDLGPAEAMIAELPPEAEMYALIRDGMVVVNGDRCCVLIVEAEERGMANRVSYMQRFEPKRFLRRFKVVGEPYAALPAAPRFR